MLGMSPIFSYCKQCFSEKPYPGVILRVCKLAISDYVGKWEEASQIKGPQSLVRVTARKIKSLGTTKVLVQQPYHGILQEEAMWPVAVPQSMPKSTSGPVGQSPCHFLIFLIFLIYLEFLERATQSEIFLPFPGTWQDAGSFLRSLSKGACGGRAITFSQSSRFSKHSWKQLPFASMLICSW